jgi:hypothetical protein
MKGGRSDVDSKRVVRSEGGDRGEGAGVGEAFAIEDRDARPGISDSVEGGVRGKEAFPGPMAGSTFYRVSFRSSIRDRGDDLSPRWFLYEEYISGGQLKDTFHGRALFIDISGEDNEGEVGERLFRHRARNLRLLRKFA